MRKYLTYLGFLLCGIAIGFCLTTQALVSRRLVPAKDSNVYKTICGSDVEKEQPHGR